MTRLFIAVNLQEEIKSYLREMRESFSEIRKGCSWVKRENLHVTLKFLGEVKEEEIKSVTARLEAIHLPSFSLSLNKLGFFPNEKNMRVFWVNFIDGKSLKRLSDEINLALSEFNDDHPFKDHITLARIKFLSSDEKNLFAEKATCLTLERKEFTVNEFILMHSTLTQQGAIYNVLKRFELKKEC